MPRLLLAISLLSAFLLNASIGHLQAQLMDSELAGVCPTPTTGYGAAMGYFISSGATPGGESHKLANKTCFNQDPRFVRPEDL
jgi:hypothetical protein